jgi:hypothetical protein
LRENVLVEFDAPPAPVRPCKIEEQKFVVRLRLFLRLAVIMLPIGFRSREGSENKRDRGSYYLLSLQQPDATTPGYRRKS